MVMLHDCENTFEKFAYRPSLERNVQNKNDSKTLIFVMRIKALTEYLQWPKFLLGSFLVILSNSHQVDADQKNKVRDGRGPV